MFTTLLRIIKFASQDFWRNIWLTLTTITVITLTFISISLLLIFNDLTTTIINTVQRKIDISVYMKNTVAEEQLQQFKNYLSKISEIKDVTLIAREESLKRFKERHQDNQAIISSLEELGENPLGASFLIRANNVHDYTKILEEINQFPNADYIADKNFDNYELLINRSTVFSDKIKQVGIFLSVIFGIISILIVFNTIRVSIYTHQDEIEVMKLVGATNFFIRSPFLMVIIFYTAVAALLAYAIFYPLVNLIHPYLWQYFEGAFNLQSYFFNQFIKLLAIELIVMIIINLLASSIAIRKYLRK